ncbi:TMEM175 family protein, partial [Pseudomonas aeruginosa]|uniref:TMEM175 family protein n=1 Tax=Pseudomonas aeruginosa TaxID=287 RepID=UPI003C6E3F05
LKDELWLRFPQFFGFVLSFTVIGQFWTNHHRWLGLGNNFNNGLLWLNLHMLFWIVLVPFTSGLNSHYGDLDLVWQIYSLNLFMIGLSLFFLN